MKNRAAALLLSLLAVRVQAAAPVEVRALAEIPSAPAALVPAAASASSLAPSLAAPSISAPALLSPTALSAAVAAPVAAAAPVPAQAPRAAIAALPAAAAGSERASAPSGGESADKASAGALFDGAGVPSDAEIAALYNAARPGSPAVAALDRQGGFAAAAGQIIHQYTFVKENLLQSLRASPATLHPEGRQIIKAVEELVSVADSRDDPASRRFLQALGRRAAAEYVGQALAARLQASGFRDRRGGEAERRHMPRNDLGSGDYWDMAAGMNAGGFILSELEPGTRYSFFDFSPFVVAYLNAVAARHGADAAAIEADILKLQRPERPLAVLRTKNAVAYVPGFEDKLAEMADWVAPGGRLVIQNDPMAGQRLLIVQKHGALAQRLIEEGWSFAFEFESSRAAAHDLDTLSFTRPKGPASPRSPQETRAEWGRYLAAVKFANAREGY
jgi:hypothetical protein